MTKILSLDPGFSTGFALGFFDAITPYQLLDRGQVLNGADGFADWLLQGNALDVDVIVCESFRLLGKNKFVADTIPLLLEGILWGMHAHPKSVIAQTPIVWQSAADKATLIGYPDSADTPDRRQRLRFKFLAKHGLHAPGKRNDDSNDAICHALVYLKRREHMPTTLALWPDRRLPFTGKVTPISAAPSF